MPSKPTLSQAQRAIKTRHKVIGRGAGRTVYLSMGDAWVFKVIKRTSYASYRLQNKIEVQAYSILKEKQRQGLLPEFIRIPETIDLGSGIVAQRYIKGYRPHPEWSATCNCPKREPSWGGKCWMKIISEYDFLDMHRDNLRVAGGLIWIIDMGMENTTP